MVDIHIYARFRTHGNWAFGLASICWLEHIYIPFPSWTLKIVRKDESRKMNQLIRIDNDMTSKWTGTDKQVKQWILLTIVECMDCICHFCSFPWDSLFIYLKEKAILRCVKLSQPNDTVLNVHLIPLCMSYSWIIDRFDLQIIIFFSKFPIMIGFNVKFSDCNPELFNDLLITIYGQ